jgi:hypothetical protein
VVRSLLHGLHRLLHHIPHQTTQAAVLCAAICDVCCCLNPAAQQAKAGRGCSSRPRRGAAGAPNLRTQVANAPNAGHALPQSSRPRAFPVAMLMPPRTAHLLLRVPGAEGQTLPTATVRQGVAGVPRCCYRALPAFCRRSSSSRSCLQGSNAGAVRRAGAVYRALPAQ